MRRTSIISLINKELAPSQLFVENESDQHHGPPGRETHFKVIVISDQFSGLNRVSRHQLVYKLLEKELQSGLHALALKLFTESEWQEKGHLLNLTSPNCSSKNQL